ncbi:hypothetical protein CK203_017391 [Vitis vinifera]|uniref:FAM192A/Fyv6 N-terminal domain-containing protein n=1 Tax=Vitis vinifera TaxID=29760 RepID=A0A438IY69_VITVI|nr:hypothetical protein CK203_017391 [Vitis vinifera]
MDEETSSLPPMRLMNFISEEQLDESKKVRGERADDGTAQRDRPLFEILKENKDKRDAEFNERFKHRPPKALDEDETEFLDNLEMSRRDYEQKMAKEEAQQLRSFQVAVAAQSTIVHELKDTPPAPKVQILVTIESLSDSFNVLSCACIREQKPVVRKNPPSHRLGMIIKVKPQAKKAKVDPANSEGSEIVKTPSIDTEKPSDLEKKYSVYTDEAHDVPANGLVSYSDESEEDD